MSRMSSRVVETVCFVIKTVRELEFNIIIYVNRKVFVGVYLLFSYESGVIGCSISHRRDL